MAEKAIKNAIELRTELEHNVALLNEAISNNASNDEVGKAIDAAETKCAELNNELRLEKYAAIRADENPMRKAILDLIYPQVKVKRIVDKKTNAVSYELSDAFAYIDLIELENFCGSQIGHAAGWRYKPEDLARFLAAKATKELGGDWKDLVANFHMSKQAERTQIADPTSGSQLTKRLQNVVDAIYFIDNGSGLNTLKVTSKDIAFMQLVSCKKGRKPLTVTMPQGKTVLNLAMQVINRIMTDGSYESLYKRNEEK